MEDTWKVSDQGKANTKCKYLDSEDEGEDCSMKEEVRTGPPETTRGDSSRASRMTYHHSDFKENSLSRGEYQRAPPNESKS